MAEKITPEEKLLRIIENPAADLKKELKSRAKKFRLRLSFKGLKRNILQAWLSKDRLKPYLFNLKIINRSLAVLSAVIAVFLIFDFIKGRPDLSPIYLHASGTSEGAADIKTSLEVKAVSLSEYLSQIDMRDIFHFVPIKKENVVSSAKEIMVSLISNFKLVGIIWGKFPQAMIEDKQENKTWLLNQGDEIGKDKGKLKIKQILRDRVILGYEDQEMELM